MHPLMLELKDAREKLTQAQAALKSPEIGRLLPGQRHKKGSLLFTQKKKKPKTAERFSRIFRLPEDLDLEKDRGVYASCVEEGWETAFFREGETGVWVCGAGEWLFGVAPNLAALVEIGFGAVQPVLADPEAVADALDAVEKAESRLASALQSIYDACFSPPQEGLYETFGGQTVRVLGAGFKFVSPYAVPENGEEAYTLQWRRGCPAPQSQSRPEEWFGAWSLFRRLEGV